jgi:putative nucleotidyltransferase with HDIG domain
MPNRVKIFVAMVVLSAVAIVMVTAAQAHGVDQHAIRLVLGLAGFAVIAELMVYKMPQGGQGSIALIPFLAIALVHPAWESLLVIGLAEGFVQAIRRRPPVKIVFNIAQAIVASGASVNVYSALGGRPFADVISLGVLLEQCAVPAFAALIAFAMVNSVAVSAVIALSQQQKFEDIWAQNTLGTASYYLLAWPLAALLAWMHTQVSPVAAVALAIPMIGVRQLYKTTLQLQRTNRELLEWMVKAIEARDPYTSGHSRRVAENATIIAKGYGIAGAPLERVRIAALLHDIGKMHEIYAPILRKEGSLTKEEWDVMKTHPDKGAELVATLSDLHDIVAPIRHHHENWDGTGYPAGIAGESIPLASRIITFADTIDALMTDRPYRRARTEAEVRAELVRCRGSQFDPDICDLVLSQAVWSQLFTRSTPTQLKVVRNSGAGRAAMGA